MGIQNVRVPLNRVTATGAVVTWNTTDDFGNPVDASTELKLCKIEPPADSCNVGPPTTQAGADSPNHEYVLSGLTPDREYICVAVSRTPEAVLSCDPDPLNPSDPAPCTKRFRTLTQVGDVDSITVTSDSARIPMNGKAQLTITAKVQGQNAPSGRVVNFTIMNGEGGIIRGHFEPDPAQTIDGGTATADFVGEHLGKAKIQVSCQKAQAQIDIEVRP